VLIVCLFVISCMHQNDCMKKPSSASAYIAIVKIGFFVNNSGNTELIQTKLYIFTWDASLKTLGALGSTWPKCQRKNPDFTVMTTKPAINVISQRPICVKFGNNTIRESV